MIKICFATNNKNKLQEIREILVNEAEILSLEDINCHEELQETQPTIEGNSLQKAQYVFDKYGINCFADDTGLLVEALDGAPGVYSARYAGEPSNGENNMKLLLQNLEGIENRKAHFKTVITYISAKETVQFEGIVNGNIATAKKGEKGFGYDPIFVPEGYTQSFAELSSEEKNKISHRGIATRKLEEYLQAIS